MLNALQINQKIIPYRPFHRALNRRNFEGFGKVLAVSVLIELGIGVQLYQPTPIGWLSLLCVYKWITVSEIHELLSISVRR